MTRCTFGDTDLAAERLERVEATFEPTTRALLDRARPHLRQCRRIADLAPFDLIYARYLLAHLPDVPSAIDVWCTALAPGGLLMLEEPESITSADDDFARYEQIASALVRGEGGAFYAGPLIAAAPLPFDVDPLIDEAIAVDVTAGQAAAMFWRNAAVWRDRAVEAGLAAPDEIDGLVERLRAREGDGTRGLFDWRQRQTVLVRR